MAKGRDRCRGLRHIKKKKEKGGKKRKHDGSSLYSPSELSDSKEEATLGADFSLVWPKRKKKKRNSKKKLEKKIKI